MQIRNPEGLLHPEHLLQLVGFAIPLRFERPVFSGHLLLRLPCPCATPPFLFQLRQDSSPGRTGRPSCAERFAASARALSSGWSMANNLRTELVLDAVNMAIYTRRPSPGLIHHSDRGSQYTSVEFGSRLREEGLLPSIGSVADAYDNSMAESFVSTLKRELIHRHSWPARHIARSAIFEYIEGFYNTRRRHSALGHLSPSEYEEVRLRGGAVA